MGVNMKERMIEIINRMNSCQEMEEKTSFDIINQHDKVANLICQLVMSLDGFMTKMEALNYAIEDTMSNISLSQCNEAEVTIKRFINILEDQGIMIAKVSQLLHTITEEQQIESEVIHEMEALIAGNRENLEELSLLHNE